MKFATKPYDIIHVTIGMLLHYLGKLKIQIFCRYSADMEVNANKLDLMSSNCSVCQQWTWYSAMGTRFVLEVCFWRGLSSWLETKSLTVSIFSSVRALRGLPLPGRLLTVPVSHNFSTVIKTTLCKAFLSKFVCQPFCCVPLQIKLSIKVFSSSLQWRLLWPISGATNWSQVNK